MDAQQEGEPAGAEEVPQEGPLRNETPLLIWEVFNIALSTVQEYGWFLLMGLACLVYAYVKLKPYLRERQRKQDETNYYKKYDAGTVLERQEAMDAARQRLQTEHDKQAAIFAEKQKEREDKKRQEKLAEWDRYQQGAGYKLGNRSGNRPSDKPQKEAGDKTKPKPKARLRDDGAFNAMMGAGGGSNYRPARRGGAGGG